MLRLAIGQVIITLAAAIGCGDDEAAEPAGFGECDDPVIHEGSATYYDFADGTGACGFDATADPMIGAMNAIDYDAAGACGACAQIEGGDGEITIRVVDLCPECDEGWIDLSPGAFSELAELEVGVIPITWWYVPCELSGPIRYRFKEGSNQWWTAVQIRNHRNGIASVEARVGGEWVDVPRTDYNYFVAESGLGEGPYDFRVTDVYGNVLEDTGIPHIEAGEVDGAAQFPDCS